MLLIPSAFNPDNILTRDTRLAGQIKGRLCLSQGEKATLAEIVQRLGRKALAEVAVVA